jgi:ketosteroid isomerase-like protein
MTHDEIELVAQRFFTAIETSDIETAGALYADDVAVWHNNDRAVQDKATNLMVLRWMSENTSDRSYGDIQRVIVDDGFVQQHVLRGRNHHGAQFELPAMMRVWVANGQITRLDEYFDSAHVAAVVG